MNSLIDQRSPTLTYPTSLDGPTVVFRGPIPLHICVCLENSSQSSIRNCFFKELSRIIEPVLAHHAELNPSLARDFDHCPSSSEGSRNRLLHQNMLLCFCA